LIVGSPAVDLISDRPMRRAATPHKRPGKGIRNPCSSVKLADRRQQFNFAAGTESGC
jgi:hypothetical protein